MNPPIRESIRLQFDRIMAGVDEVMQAVEMLPGLFGSMGVEEERAIVRRIRELADRLGATSAAIHEIAGRMEKSIDARSPS